MLRRLMRCTLVGAGLTVTSLPSNASAQVGFQSCATPGVCGWVEAFFTASVLTVRLSNQDALVGSALYSAQIIFSSAINPANPGAAFSRTATATASNATLSIGATPANAWSFTGVGGSNVLDLASFMNVYIEGMAASAYRAVDGDVNNGTWITPNANKYVEFSADLAGLQGLGEITDLSFCTDVDCVTGPATVATPEPATLALVATGMLGLAAHRRRKNKTRV